MEMVALSFTPMEDKPQGWHKVLVLGPVPGKKTKNTLGLVDSRLFTGENNLHAHKDKETCMWYLKYERGIVPEPFKQQFTSLHVLLKFAKDYFIRRDIEIKDVIDA